MELDKARDFIREHHRAVMATRRADGAPQMSIVAANVDDDGRVVVSTRETAVKTKNLRRDPRVSFCILPDDGWSGPLDPGRRHRDGALVAGGDGAAGRVLPLHRG